MVEVLPIRVELGKIYEQHVVERFFTFSGEKKLHLLLPSFELKISIFRVSPENVLEPLKKILSFDQFL